MVLAAAAELEVLIAQDTGADFPARLAMLELLTNRMGHKLRRKPGVRSYARVPEMVLWPQQHLTQLHHISSTAQEVGATTPNHPGSTDRVELSSLRTR
jgi:hypothetical protein